MAGHMRTVLVADVVRMSAGARGGAKEVLGGFKRSSQHLSREVSLWELAGVVELDGLWSSDAFAWSATRLAT
jgi:hypothetical protein